MINLFTRYSPRANPPDSNYPLGSIKNESVPGADDGTPLEKDWGNNIEGFHQSLLAEANITANGVPDKVGSSQLLTSLKKLFISASKTISENISLNVPSQYATINDAMDYLAGKTIAAGVTVTINVADGVYQLTKSINLNHPYGSQIKLIGNQNNPDNCIILGANPPTFDAVVCSNGNRFGFFDGFFINLTQKATIANNSTGLLANNGASIVCGQKVKTNNWYYGIAARNGSFISCNGAIVNNGGDVGIWAFVGSTIEARNAASNNCSDASNPWGFGFQAEYGSALDCSGSSASGNKIGGIASLSNSNVRALNSTSNSNTGSGFFARDGGTIECHDSTANNNTRYALEEIGSSRITGGNITASGNLIGYSKNIAYLDNLDLGARIAANGDFRLDVNGANNWYFNSSGGAQFSISHTASAANRWNVSGSAAGSGLTLQATGDDSKISANINAKGNEVVRLNSNGKTAFQSYNSSASAVNYLQANGAASGSYVEMAAEGSDSVIDIRLTPKGSGSYIILGSGYNAGSLTPTGWIAIKDNTGTVRRLLVG